MRLLLDENLSPRLVALLSDVFPQSAHVHDLGLGSADDEAIWKHAREHGFAIVTKDSEFHERSLLQGYPPKVVWIRRGNCSTDEIAGILRRHEADIRALGADADAAALMLY